MRAAALWLAIALALAAILSLPMAVQSAEPPAKLPGQYTYMGDGTAPLAAKRWYLVTEPCKDKAALSFIPPQLRSIAKQGRVVDPIWNPGHFSFCWFVTKKGYEVVLVWPGGEVDVEAFHKYSPDKGI